MPGDARVGWVAVQVQELTMQFGVFIPQGWKMDLVGIEPSEQWTTMSTLVKRVDAGPWDSAWVYDHFHTVPEPTQDATHEAWTLMAGFAAVTDRVRLGQMCTCMSYRNPVYLAKVAATVDIISGGRTEMGVGAGWYEHEWRAYGYGFPPAGERIRALDEGVQIMRQAWTTGSATQHGRIYQVDGAIVRPLPLQAGGIPLWIAGGGEKKTLRIAAQYANYTNFDGTLAGFQAKSAILAQHCRDVGRDFSDIVRSANYNPVIGANAAEVDQRLDWSYEHQRQTLSEEKARGVRDGQANGPLVGTPGQLIDQLRALQEVGMTYAIVYFDDIAYDRTAAELFAREVVPALAG
jgi:F420-dependent oxidoreductase-like protein